MIKKIFGSRERAFDLGLAVIVVAVVVMMVVPLTPWLLDLLISLNLGISVLILSLSLFLKRPLGFTVFPTLLLIATLYRLALNVSSTRLILLRADAGQIISGFGGFVVGGDILVGAVIFGILAMVLFLVITKGAERVAEVAARFTLDGLPGMQLAIDADLRAGAVSGSEAGRRRAELDRQSRYYGALDGAMKFVRGDAVASLIIVGVNILGGVAVGTLRHDMSVGRAVDTYGRLTVGDGLVTLIPALLISTAAGLLVTRVGQRDGDVRLGSEIGRQLGTEPRALAASAALLLVLALVPTLPAWPFLLVGGAIGIAAWDQFRREQRRGLTQDRRADELLDRLIPEAPCVLELGARLYGALTRNARSGGGLQSLADRLAAPLRDELGLPVATVPIIEAEASSNGGVARLRLKRVVVDQTVFADDGFGPDDLLDTVGGWLKGRAGQLVDMDIAQALVDRLALERPVLVRETVPKLIALPALAELLAGLVADGISLDHLPRVLDALSRIEETKNPERLLEQVRQGLASVITADLLHGRDRLTALVLDADVAAVLDSSLVPTTRGSRLVLQPQVVDEMVAALQQSAADRQDIVLLVQSELRRPLAAVLAGPLPDMRVVSHAEIEPHVKVDVAARVAL